MRSRKIIWAAVAAVALVAVTGLQAVAWYALGPTEPAVIATVDLERVYGAINERAARDAALQAEADALEAERVRLSDKVTELREELSDGMLTAGTPQYQALEDEFVATSLDLKVLVDHARLKIEAEQAQILSDMYALIKETAAQMAIANNWDMVLVDDSLAEMVPGNEAEITRQISARRMLYVNSALDVTNEIIAEMNR